MFVFIVAPHFRLPDTLGGIRYILAHSVVPGTSWHTRWYHVHSFLHILAHSVVPGPAWSTQWYHVHHDTFSGAMSFNQCFQTIHDQSKCLCALKYNQTYMHIPMQIQSGVGGWVKNPLLRSLCFDLGVMPAWCSKFNTAHLAGT